jgi:hypothetical protein
MTRPYPFFCIPNWAIKYLKTVSFPEPEGVAELTGGHDLSGYLCISPGLIPAPRLFLIDERFILWMESIDDCGVRVSVYMCVCRVQYEHSCQRVIDLSLSSPTHQIALRHSSQVQCVTQAVQTIISLPTHNRAPFPTVDILAQNKQNLAMHLLFVSCGASRSSTLSRKIRMSVSLELWSAFSVPKGSHCPYRSPC